MTTRAFLMTIICVLSASPAVPALATITGTTGSVLLVSPPGDARRNRFADASHIHVWNERQNVVLTSPLEYDAGAPGTYNQPRDLGDYTLPAGTRLSSHYLHFDTPADDESTLTGSVTFDEDIIAIVEHGDNDPPNKLDASDWLSPGTTYPDGMRRRGFEFDQGIDTMTISTDRRTLSVYLRVTDYQDCVRIITRAFCPSDFNRDEFVTGDDFDAFVVEFVAGNPAADFNKDGFVTGDDFDAFVVQFIQGC